MGRIISIINYKGGVGKTTTTFHIGCALAKFHKLKVLLIDDDPQTNLTFLCTNDKDWKEQVEAHGSLEALYKGFVEGNSVPIRDTIWLHPMPHPDLKNVDLIPSDITLLDIDLRLQSRTKPSTTIQEVARTHLSQRSILADALAGVAADYDYILIDCPPNLYLATQNALYASDGYLVTLMPDYFSAVGVAFLDKKVSQLLGERELARQILNPDSIPVPRLPFYLTFVKVNVTAGKMQIVAKEQMASVRGALQFANRCFESITEDYKDIREATTEQLPVFLHSPNSQNSQNYQRMTQEFLRSFPNAAQQVNQQQATTKP
ncbi:MAG: ParA family protein [Terriglobia bacterium]